MQIDLKIFSEPTGKEIICSDNTSLLHVLSKGTVALQLPENQSIKVLTGAYFLTPKGAETFEYTWRNLTGKPIELLTFVFDENNFKGLDGIYDDFVLHAVKLLYQYRHNKTYFETIAKALIIHLQTVNVLYFEPKLAMKSHFGSQVNLIKNYILQHLAEEIYLDELAALVAMSKFNFIRKFKQEMGITPYQFIKNMRLELSNKLLQETSLTIAEIAYQVGYEQPSSFSKDFKAYFKELPNQIRKSNKDL